MSKINGNNWKKLGYLYIFFGINNLKVALNNPIILDLTKQNQSKMRVLKIEDLERCEGYEGYEQ